ncbi:MAG: hypothetical protein IJW48_01475 [Clostridia bacterium]|nr:hypothetical protein [Clostridia bacterium]
MEDNIQNEEVKESAKPKMRFGERVENFWYHYKWHSIVAVFVIIAVTVCTLQMCSKERFDNYILYAGGYGISRNGADDVAEYSIILSSMKKVSRDVDENGEIVTSFLDLYAPTPSEMDASGSDLYNLTIENFDRLKYELISGSEYYVCLLSEYNYDEYKEWDGVRIFTPLAPYTKEGNEYEYYDECAIYLHSTEFGELDGLKNLPDDTLIVLRSLSAVASAFGRDESQKNFEYGEELMRSILAYKKQ